MQERSGNMGIRKNDSSGDKSKKIPEEIGILPLRHLVAYPYMALPLAVGHARQMRLIEDAVNDGCLVGLLTTKEPNVDTPAPGRCTRLARWPGFIGR